MRSGFRVVAATAIIAAAGSPVWRAEPIRASRRGDTVIASVWVPSERLAGGTYDITLKQGDSDIGRFVFSVERR